MSSQSPFCVHHPQKSVHHCNGPAILTTEKEPGVVCQKRLALICKGCLHGNCQDIPCRRLRISKDPHNLPLSVSTWLKYLHKKSVVLTEPSFRLQLQLVSVFKFVLVLRKGYLPPYLQGIYVPAAFPCFDFHRKKTLATRTGSWHMPGSFLPEILQDQYMGVHRPCHLPLVASQFWCDHKGWIRSNCTSNVRSFKVSRIKLGLC